MSCPCPRVSTSRRPPCHGCPSRDLSGLTPALTGLEGVRVEVVTTYGETRRFWVGVSTGWRPCHLEVKTTRSFGGDAAEKEYRSVRIIRYR